MSRAPRDRVGRDGATERGGRARYACSVCGRERWSSNPDAGTEPWVCPPCGTVALPAGPFLQDRPPDGYNTLHRRLHRQRGPASAERCVDCGTPARDWSYDGLDPDEQVGPGGLRYSLDPGHYVPRCLRCHRRYDRGG